MYLFGQHQHCQEWEIDYVFTLDRKYSLLWHMLALLKCFSSSVCVCVCVYEEDGVHLDLNTHGKFIFGILQ